MREILFRGKCIEGVDDGKWVEGYVSGPCETDTEKGIVSYYFMAVDGQGGPKECIVSAETVCQYTGLTDKNGRKIFEGDIVKDTSIHTIGKVFYWGYEGRFAVDDIYDGKQLYTGEMWEDVEVIGNIFDNPELLKGAQND